MPRCGIVILAAGASVRMGVAKQSLKFEGATLLLRAVHTALKSNCEPVVIVLGARADELQKSLCGQTVEVILNESWSAGMGTSIRAGVSAIASQPIDAAMIFLCDQPLISAAILDRMVEAHFSSDQSITAAFYGETTGTPVIFSASYFDELKALGDAHGGKSLLKKYPDRVQMFPLPEAEMDIDTPSDYQKLSGRLLSPGNTTGGPG
jgi:molybdenum cofactor cytidylyltransferase